ncbi:hypothetical protein B0H13DRAFT_2438293, partial [Mycena leptocephala]
EVFVALTVWSYKGGHIGNAETLAGEIHFTSSGGSSELSWRRRSPPHLFPSSRISSVKGGPSSFARGRGGYIAKEGTITPSNPSVSLRSERLSIPLPSTTSPFHRPPALRDPESYPLPTSPSLSSPRAVASVLSAGDLSQPALHRMANASSSRTPEVERLKRLIQEYEKMDESMEDPVESTSQGALMLSLKEKLEHTDIEDRGTHRATGLPRGTSVFSAKEQLVRIHLIQEEETVVMGDQEETAEEMADFHLGQTIRVLLIRTQALILLIREEEEEAFPVEEASLEEEEAFPEVEEVGIGRVHPVLRDLLDHLEHQGRQGRPVEDLKMRMFSPFSRTGCRCQQ